MAKAVGSAFKWVGKIAGGVAGFALKPIIRALTPPLPEIDTESAVNFRADPNSGVPYVIGQTATAGVYTYATVGEEKNRNLLFHAVLSGGGPIESFVSFKAGGTTVVFDGPDTPESGPYRHLMWMRKQLGATSGPALMPPNTLDAGVLSEWTSAHKTSGYATAWYVLGADQKAYASGVPDPLWILKGVKVYDWRDDSTYPGGNPSGPQRIDNPATWKFSENPAVHAVAWCRGYYLNGKRLLGLGASLAQIVMARATEWANVCDANNWKVGGVVYSTDTKWQVLKAICQGGGAYPIPLGTQISFIFNAPRVSIATLTGADIEGQPTIIGGQMRRDKFNKGTVRYREPANEYKIVPAAALTVASFVTADGGVVRPKEFEFPLVQNVNQATQLLAYGMCNARELGPIDFSVIPYWMGLEPGDCITVNENEFALTNQKMVVVGRSRSLMNCERSLSCVTETDTKHSFCLGLTGTPPVAPSLTAVDTVPTPPDPSDWTVIRGYVTGPGGTLPAIIIDGECTDPNAIEIIFEYREVGDLGEWSAVNRPITAKHVEITGIRAGVNYDVRVRYRYARNTENPDTGNTGLGTVITLPVDAKTLGGVSITQLNSDIEDVQDAVDAAQLDADAALAALFTPGTGVVSEVDVLQSGQATHTSQIGALQTADISMAGRITVTEGKLVVTPNLIKNPEGKDPTPLRYWINTVGATVGYNAIAGSHIGVPANSSGASKFLVTDVYPYIPTVVISASLYGDPSTNAGAARATVWIQFVNSGGGVVGTPVGMFLDNSNISWTKPAELPNRSSSDPSVVGFQFVYAIPNGHTGSSFSRVMVNPGAVSLPFNDMATNRDTLSRVQTTEIASSTNAAAIAATDTRVGVSMQQGSYLNANGRMGSYTTTPGLPDGWPTIWGSALASRFSRQVGEGANYSVRAAPAAAEVLGFYQPITLTAGDYLLTFEGKCNSGDWSGAGLTVSGVYSINCLTDPDLAGVTGAGGTGIRRWSRIATIPAGTYNFHVMYGYATFGTITAKSLDIYVAGIQPLDAAGKTAKSASADATDALIASATNESALAAFEIDVNAQLDGLDASVTSQGTAISNLQGRTASWLTKVAAAGSDPAYIYMQSDASAAGGADSYIALVSKETYIYNTVGGTIIRAMYASGGNVFFDNDVRVGGNLVVDGTLTGPKLATGAVVISRQYRAYAPGGSDTSALTWSDHNTVSADTTMVAITQSFSGNELTVKPQLNMWWFSGASLIGFGIKYDGVIVKKWWVTGGLSSIGNIQLYTPSWRHTPSAGTHTYELCLLTQGVSQTVRVGERVLELEERNGGWAVDTSGGSA